METKDINLREILAEIFEIKKEKIKINTDNNNLKEWDSLSHVALIVKLEEKLGINLEAREASRITSVKEILKLLKKYSFQPLAEDLVKEHQEL